MKSPALIAALVAPLLLANPAGAATQDFGVLSATPKGHSYSNPPGSFMDTANFMITAPGLLHVTMSDLDLVEKTSMTVIFNNDDLTGTLWNNHHPNGDTNLGSLGTFDQTFEFFLPAAGKYHVDFAGVATGSFGGVYGASLSVTSPVPEPTSPALLLAGIGVLAFVGRRRQIKE